MTYAVGGIGLTMAINVAINNALAAAAVPDDPAQAATLWAGYSGRWQD